MKKVKIDGMMCMHCVGSVKKAFESAGIDADVRLDEKCAYVKADIDNDRLRTIVTDAGYEFLGAEPITE